MEKSKECMFCRIVDGSAESFKVYEDNQVFAFLDNRPLFDGHVLLVTKRHANTLYDLNDKEIAAFFKNVKMISRAVQTAMESDGIFIAMNITVGQSVPHVHMHIIPRKYNDGLRWLFWPRHRYPSKEYAQNICDVIKKEIKKEGRRHEAAETKV